MRIVEKGKWAALLALVGLLLAPSAHSDVVTTISGTHNLLDYASADLLEGWLGEGELAFTNIFTKAPGDNSIDFHAAADGAGPTFSLIEILDANGEMLQVIGGYNPQSWASNDVWNLTLNDADRTAFIFNLTDDTPRVFYQKPTTFSDGWRGQYQTGNLSNYGPIFGLGPDLFVTGDLNMGHTFSWSYGADGVSGFFATVSEINAYFTVGQIEVFTFAPSVSEVAVAPVPVPAAAGLGLLGMGLVSALRRRKKTVRV